MEEFGWPPGVAAYHEGRQVIELSEVTREQFELARAAEDPRASLKVNPVLNHELRHWVDHVGTLWGQKNLALAYEAYAARDSNDPSQFWKICDYLKSNRSDRLTEYYTIVETDYLPAFSGHPWKYQLTAGQRFDRSGRLDAAAPVIFTRFRWPDDHDAARVPFTVSSLLELGAIFFEEMTMVDLHGRLGSDGVVDRRTHERDLLRRIYDPNLAVYSVGVHLVANKMGYGDVLQALLLGSGLARVCLNLPDALFDSLVVPREFSPWEDANRAFVASRNRGYLFAALVHHLPSERGGSIDEEIQAACGAAGLGSLETIKSATLDALTKMPGVEVEWEWRDRLNWLRELGRSTIISYGVVDGPDTKVISDSPIAWPPVFLNDDTAVTLGAPNPWLEPEQLGTWMRCNRSVMPTLP